MFGKKEFGVRYDTEVTDMSVPWHDGMLEADWCWGGRAASSEGYLLCFVDIDSQFPFGECRIRTDVVWVSRLTMVSVRQDCLRIAVSLAYNASCVLGDVEYQRCRVQKGWWTIPLLEVRLFG